MKKLIVLMLSLTLLTGCSVSSNSLLFNNPTEEELFDAKVRINEAREEVHEDSATPDFAKNIADWALDLAESVVDSKTKGDD